MSSKTCSEVRFSTVGAKFSVRKAQEASSLFRVPAAIFRVQAIDSGSLGLVGAGIAVAVTTPEDGGHPEVGHVGHEVRDGPGNVVVEHVSHRPEEVAGAVAEPPEKSAKSAAAPELSLGPQDGTQSNQHSNGETEPHADDQRVEEQLTTNQWTRD